MLQACEQAVRRAYSDFQPLRIPDAAPDRLWREAGKRYRWPEVPEHSAVGSACRRRFTCWPGRGLGKAAHRAMAHAGDRCGIAHRLIRGLHTVKRP